MGLDRFDRAFIKQSGNAQTILKKTYVKPSSHRISDPIIDDDDAELVTNVNKAKKDDGTYTNIGATNSGNLRTTRRAG